jgi:dihydroorotate dehydrogenase electron transfer subunit
MCRLEAGTELKVLTGLGNGYDLTKAGEKPLLIGGGAGVPPMYFLAKKLRASGKKVSVIIGFNTAEEAFYESEFSLLGCRTAVTTADGSLGVRGFVTDALPDDCSYYYACGPVPMLKAVYDVIASDGEMSFEERMGCGFGACMGCSRKTTNGYSACAETGRCSKRGR